MIVVLNATTKTQTHAGIQHLHQVILHTLLVRDIDTIHLRVVPCTHNHKDTHNKSTIHTRHILTHTDKHAENHGILSLNISNQFFSGTSWYWRGRCVRSGTGTRPDEKLSLDDQRRRNYLQEDAKNNVELFADIIKKDYIINPNIIHNSCLNSGISNLSSIMVCFTLNGTQSFHTVALYLCTFVILAELYAK